MNFFNQISSVCITSSLPELLLLLLLLLLFVLLQRASTGSRFGENPASGSSLFIEVFDGVLVADDEDDDDVSEISSMTSAALSFILLMGFGCSGASTRGLATCSSLSVESESEDEIASIL